MYDIETLDPLVSPASAQELIDWARLDSDDPKIAGSLLAATRIVISFLKLELLPRTYTLTYEDWPTVGTTTGRTLSAASYQNKLRVDIPYANLLSVTSVKVNGDVLPTDCYKIIKGKPDKIQFETIGYNNLDTAAIEMIYSAGFTTVPAPIVQAVVMAAAYVHAHAGGCDSGSALNESGAVELLRPYAVMAGLSF